MILKQVIKYDNAPALEATWCDENENIIKCQAYSADQMGMLAADLGDDAPTYQSLMDEIAAQYVPPTPQPKPPRQFTSLEFLDLFTEAEQLAVAEAALQSAQVKLWYDRLLAASYITLSDPRVEAGLSSLVEAGLLTSDRRIEIVEAMQ